MWVSSGRAGGLGEHRGKATGRPPVVQQAKTIFARPAVADVEGDLIETPHKADHLVCKRLVPPALHAEAQQGGREGRRGRESAKRPARDQVTPELLHLVARIVEEARLAQSGEVPNAEAKFAAEDAPGQVGIADSIEQRLQRAVVLVRSQQVLQDAPVARVGRGARQLGRVEVLGQEVFGQKEGTDLVVREGRPTVLHQEKARGFWQQPAPSQLACPRDHREAISKVGGAPLQLRPMVTGDSARGDDCGDELVTRRVLKTNPGLAGVDDVERRGQRVEDATLLLDGLPSGAELP